MLIVCRALLAYLITLWKKNGINLWPVAKKFMCTVALVNVKHLC